MAKKKRQPSAEELAGKSFTVRVTRADILKGKPQNTNWCPIALAVKRATGVKDVDVQGDIITVDGLPEINVQASEINEFVSRFDDVTGADYFDGEHLPATKRVAPFRFRLTLPVPEVVQDAVDGEVEIL